MVDIFQAIISGDVAGVEAALSQGTDSNLVGQDGLHLVHYAAMSNQPKAYSVLIAHGANVNSTDFHNNSTLYFAARAGGSKEFIQTIINDGAKINNFNELRQTATHISARLGNVGAMQALLKSKADVNIQDIVGKSPLHDAIKTTHPEVILLLIEYGANLNSKDKYNATPMSLGLASTNSDINEIFNLPVINKLQIPVNNALFEAVVTHNLDAVKAALGTQNVNSTNASGLTPLHYASLHGDADIIKYLVDHGASIVRTDYDGSQAMHFAAMGHHVEAIDVLLASGGKINALDKLGNTPLHYACQHADSTAIVQKILDASPLIDMQNNKGETALHLAAYDGNLDVVKLLVANHANTTLKDKQGETALQEAIKTNHTDVVTFLSKDLLAHTDTEYHGLKPMVKEAPLALSDVLSTDKQGIPGLKYAEHAMDAQHEAPSAQSVVVTNEAVQIVPIVETLM